VVKGRSDIYAWPLPLYIPSEVTWYHAEIPRLRTLLSLPSSTVPLFLSLVSFSCSLPFYLAFPLFLSPSTSPLLSCLIFPSFFPSFLSPPPLPALYHPISSSRIVRFISMLLHISSSPASPDSGITLAYSWTRIMSG